MSLAILMEPLVGQLHGTSFGGRSGRSSVTRYTIGPLDPNRSNQSSLESEGVRSRDTSSFSDTDSISRARHRRGR